MARQSVRHPIEKATCLLLQISCCKHEDIRQIEFHCGHVIAEINGGKTEIHNLRPICAQCNLSMGSMDMNEYKSLYFTPVSTIQPNILFGLMR